MEPKYIKNPSDLITSREATRSGFIEQASAKFSMADQTVHGAKELIASLKKIKSTKELGSQNLVPYLAMAAGLSEKAQRQLTLDDKMAIIENFLKKATKHGWQDFPEEIVFRYLLTKGDSLGGSMRNLTGAIASKKLTKHIAKVLDEAGHQPQIVCDDSGKIKKICWLDRVLVFDAKSKLIGKNIDLILLKTKTEDCDERALLNDPRAYLACGELKGGIDPAGADEHWKTASAALDRISRSKLRPTPKLFYIGAAIESDMADEIYERLSTGALSHAANLTKKDQVSDLVDWIVQL